MQQTTLKTARQKYGKSLETMIIVSVNRVENIVANGEIAHYEQFLNLSHCFQKTSAANVLYMEKG